MYGIPYDPSPEITETLADGDIVKFGNTELTVLFTPGHSPASISFYCKEAGIVIGGDVLFQGSIGRTDLPGGNFDTLAENCPRDQQQLAGNYGAHTTNISSICHVTTDPEIACDTANNDTVHSNTKQLNDKLKQLEMQLHHNYANDSKSSCFWCTYKFDNPSIFIPKHYLKDTYHVYGCFCSPECSVAYLMNENLDSSTKFERYYLLNNVYGSIYNYTKSIKPAPDPHYTLDKFCGNLSIQEYRAMLGNDRLYIVVDKPLTRVMPELHQANEDHIINNKMIPSNQNMVRSSKRVLNKTDILAENFGMTTA